MKQGVKLAKPRLMVPIPWTIMDHIPSGDTCNVSSSAKSNFGIFG